MTANPYDCASSSAAVYSDVRPSYPEALLDVLMRELRAADWAGEAAGTPAVSAKGFSLSVLDIGAGTGKFTAQLIDRGLDVWALEPARDMRAQFVRSLPNFPQDQLVAGAAEHIPTASGVFSAVTYAQSWHWLDTPTAAREAARVLQPRGVIAVIVNQLAVEIPWVHRLTRIMRSGDIYKPSDSPSFGADFTEPVLHTVDWEDHLTISRICELGQTRASWIRASTAQREKMRANLLWYLRDHLGYAEDEAVSLPYHAYMWHARKAD